MADVNLILQKQTKEIPESVKRFSKRVTSLVLVGYILVAGGYLAWYIFSASRTQAVSAELERLTGEVAARASEEVLVRRLDERAQLVLNFLKNRQPTERMVQVLTESGSSIREWKSQVGSDVQTIKIDTSSSEQVYEQLAFFQGKYKNTRLDKLELSELEGWTGTFVVSGLQP